MTWFRMSVKRSRQSVHGPWAIATYILVDPWGVGTLFIRYYVLDRVMHSTRLGGKCSRRSGTPLAALTLVAVKTHTPVRGPPGATIHT